MSDRAAPAVPLAALSALLTGALVCWSPAVLNDGDIYMHIAAGRWMLEHLAVLRADPLTATFAGQPWQAHEWLAEVIYALAYRAGGFAGVMLMTAAAVALTFGNLARHVGRSAGWRETLALVAAGALCVLPSVFARPHVLALPAMELWLAELLAARAQDRSPRWWSLAVMAVWANLQGGFAFGIAIAAALAIEASVAADRRPGAARRWWLFVAGSVLAAAATPQGVDGLLFPVRLLRLESLRFIQEWAPIDFREQFGVEAVLVALLALLGTGRVRLPALRLLLLLGLVHLTIAHARHAVLLGIAGPLLLAGPVGRGFSGPVAMRLQPGGNALAWSGFALLAVLRLAVPVATTDARVTPVSAVAQLPPSLIRAPVLNSVLFGGYLEWVGLRPFIDGRAELFGDDFMTSFVAMPERDGAGLARAVERHGIAWAILAAGDPLIAAFRNLAGWRQQYGDGVAVVFVRSEATQVPSSSANGTG